MQGPLLFLTAKKCAILPVTSLFIINVPSLFVWPKQKYNNAFLVRLSVRKAGRQEILRFPPVRSMRRIAVLAATPVAPQHVASDMSVRRRIREIIDHHRCARGHARLDSGNRRGSCGCAYRRDRIYGRRSAYGSSQKQRSLSRRARTFKNEYAHECTRTTADSKVGIECVHADS